MIQYNFATELCMTRGQDGYVYGWQSKFGKQNQVILDTLFIKLKNPPSEVQFEGLPENVVPIYPTTNNIQAICLQNDDRIFISHTQIEILINFAMTDFGSQGKTHSDNVCDLNNLTLSCSASAEGTLILQGFYPRKITGRCSGALHQEFRELEILDEITKFRYEGKLSVKIYGDIHNTLIQAFREWKGQQYVPNIVHSAIQWSKHDPLLESEIIDIKQILGSFNTENKKKRKVDDNICNKPKMSKGTVKKLEPTLIDNINHYLIPQGMIWSNNSCAYDSIFPNYDFQKMDNPFIRMLSDGFNDMRNLTSIESISYQVQSVVYTCSNNHCCFTDLPSLIVFEFSNQVLHINFLINVKTHNQHHRMRLAGVVYYGQHHFTSQIILSDGQIWFYDGIEIGRNLFYIGSINPNPPNMTYCRGKQAVAAIYVSV
ncbi:hypothetical protein BYT27DRAFT_7219925 [Phlegmacium glaucopus]|nr:hypothetical protein BYT27DRAFT_7219925 [Phlegmacium glaucopus]